MSSTEPPRSGSGASPDPINRERIEGQDPIPLSSHSIKGDSLTDRVDKAAQPALEKVVSDRSKELERQVRPLSDARSSSSSLLGRSWGAISSFFSSKVEAHSGTGESGGVVELPIFSRLEPIFKEVNELLVNLEKKDKGLLPRDSYAENLKKAFNREFFDIVDPATAEEKTRWVEETMDEMGTVREFFEMVEPAAEKKEKKIMDQEWFFRELVKGRNRVDPEKKPDQVVILDQAERGIRESLNLFGVKGAHQYLEFINLKKGLYAKKKELETMKETATSEEKRAIEAKINQIDETLTRPLKGGARLDPSIEEAKEKSKRIQAELRWRQINQLIDESQKQIKSVKDIEKQAIPEEDNKALVRLKERLGGVLEEESLSDGERSKILKAIQEIEEELKKH